MIRENEREHAWRLSGLNILVSEAKFFNEDDELVPVEARLGEVEGEWSRRHDERRLVRAGKAEKVEKAWEDSLQKVGDGLERAQDERAFMLEQRAF